MATFKYDLMGHDAVVEVFGAVADGYRQDPTYTEVISEEDAEKLKGDELDAALERADLPKGGKAGEKRRRLVEETAAPAGDTLTGTVAPSVSGIVTANESGATVDRDAAHSEEN